MYGVETCSLKVKTLKRIEEFEIWIVRRTLWVPWKQICGREISIVKHFIWGTYFEVTDTPTLIIQEIQQNFCQC